MILPRFHIHAPLLFMNCGEGRQVEAIAISWTMQKTYQATGVAEGRSMYNMPE
jgi:hypothetical protein